MKNRLKTPISVAAVLLVTAAILLLVFMHGNNKTSDESSDDTGAESTEQSVTAESFEEVQKAVLFSKVVKTIENGTYSITVTRQKQIGGMSVPVTTTTYYGEGFINSVEYEGHDIMSEVFVNADGAYDLNADLKLAYLLPADTFKPFTIVYKGIKYVESGSTVAGTSAYEYERFITADGQTVDYLFAGETLEKMKLYNGEEYELVSVNVSADISGARTHLPDGLSVVDNRN